MGKRRMTGARAALFALVALAMMAPACGGGGDDEGDGGGSGAVTTAAPSTSGGLTLEKLRGVVLQQSDLPPATTPSRSPPASGPRSMTA